MAGQELERYQAPNTRASLPALSIDELRTVAKAMTASGMFNIAKGGDFGQGVASAFVQLLVGQELGISIGQAMSNIHVIDGKPTFSAALMGALVKRHPSYDYRIVESTAKECRIEWFELGGRLDADGWPVRRLLGTSEFTMDDAKTAGLQDKTNWKKYPKAMLLARAMTAGSRAHAPDVFNGPVYTPDEIEAGETTDIGPILVEQDPITKVLDDGSVVDLRTGEQVMPAGSVPAEAVEGEHIPPEEVDKASETPAAGEHVQDAEVVGEAPAAPQAPAEAAQRSESGGGGSSTASPPRSGRRTGSRRRPPSGTSEASAPAEPAAAPEAPVKVNAAQLRMLQARRKGALLGEDNDDLWRIVLRSVAGVETASDVPAGKVAEMVKVLNKLEGLALDDNFDAWREWLEAAGRSIGVEVDMSDDGAET